MSDERYLKARRAAEDFLSKKTTREHAIILLDQCDTDTKILLDAMLQYKQKYNVECLREILKSAMELIK